MIYHIIINITYNYNSKHLSFSKMFELPFVPFYNMWLIDEKDGVKNEIKIENNRFVNSIIEYEMNRRTFNIYIRENWKYPVSDETIDDILDKFKKTEWNREDNTDIIKMKQLMVDDYNKNIKKN